MWTTQEVSDLRQMVSERLSYRYIAKILNKTRSACIGKAHRIGLYTEKSEPQCTQQMPKRIRALIPIKPKLVLVEPKVKSDRTVVAPISFMELDHSNCHWPIGNKFCGRKLEGKRARSTYYCPEHEKRSIRGSTGPTSKVTMSVMMRWAFGR